MTAMTSGRPGYEIRMVLLTSLMISFVAFDRLATGYFAPYLVDALGLSKTQLGALYSAQAIAVAISSYLVGRYSDRTGRRKIVVVQLLILSALCAGAPLLVQGFAALMAVRLLSGAMLGGISPITQAILTAQSTPARIGRNIGIQTLLMFLVAQMIGPIVLPRVAETLGWQFAYAASAIPFLLLALGAFFILHESPVATPVEGERASGALDAAARRTIALCLCVSACFMTWLVVNATFLSIFLVERRGLTPAAAGNILATLGVAGAIGGLTLPMLTDRLDRHKVLLGGLVLACLVPAAELFWTGSLFGFQVLLALGWLSVGVLPIYAVIIPGAAVGPRRLAAMVALITGFGEIVGGVAGPVVAGWLADRNGIASPFVLSWTMLGIAILSAAAMTISNARAAE